jgi:two-component system OmpR family response regulator
MKILFVRTDPEEHSGAERSRIAADAQLRSALSALSARAGFRLDVVSGALEALRALDDGMCEVALLYWPHHEPPWDGPRLCRTISTKAPGVGRIVWSSMPALEHKLTAFSAGADDCIEVSCDAAELVARMRAVARRSRPPRAEVSPSAPPPAGASGLVADRRTGLVTGPAGRAELTPTELRLLVLMADDAKEAVSTESLALELLSRDDVHARNLVHRHVSNLRKKLHRAGIADAVTRRRDGYLLTTRVKSPFPAG